MSRAGAQGVQASRALGVLGVQAALGFVGAVGELRMRSTPDASVPNPTWVVVKVMVPFWVPIIIRHLLFTQKGTIILTTTHLKSPENQLAGMYGGIEAYTVGPRSRCTSNKVWECLL